MKSKKAAMEMSVGTIVTIVLLMSVLVLGLMLTNKIFNVATDSVDSIGQIAKDSLNSAFSKDGGVLAFYPSNRIIRIKQGADGEGFVFAINNPNKKETTFYYQFNLSEGYDLQKNCGNSISKKEVEDWILQNQGSVTISASGSNSETPKLILFSIPKSAPKCTISYTLKVYEKTETTPVFVSEADVGIKIV